MNRTLYELADQYKHLAEMTDSDVLTPEQIAYDLNAIQDSFESKVENIGKLVLSMTGDNKIIKEEIDRLTDRKKANENHIEWLKSYLLTEMTKTNILKIKKETITVSVQNNPPSVVELDISKVPGDFIRIIPVEYQLDKQAILEFFKETNTIPDGTDIILNKKHITIK